MARAVIVFVAFFSTFIIASLDAVPQNPGAINIQNYSPYSYQYKVEDPEKQLYHDKTETQEENGKVNSEIK